MNRIDRRQVLRYCGLGVLGSFGFPTLFSLSLVAEEPHVTVPAYNKLTDEQEIELGRKFATQVEAEMEIVHNSAIDNYLGGIVARLAKASQRPNLPYSIKLVNSADINAFSLAGGFLYIHRGLAEMMGSEDELVATLGHELGHVVARHSINQIVRNFATRRLLDTVLGNLFKKNGVVEHIIGQFGGAVAMIALLHFSRTDELEADLLGFYEMIRAGWDPHGFQKLFALLEGVERRAGGHSFPYLSTHPPTPARDAAIKNELTQVNLPRGLKGDSLSFHGFKAVMETIHKPSKQNKPEGR